MLFLSDFQVILFKVRKIFKFRENIDCRNKKKKKKIIAVFISNLKNGQKDDEKGGRHKASVYNRRRSI